MELREPIIEIGEIQRKIWQLEQDLTHALERIKNLEGWRKKMDDTLLKFFNIKG